MRLPLKFQHCQGTGKEAFAVPCFVGQNLRSLGDFGSCRQLLSVAKALPSGGSTYPNDPLFPGRLFPGLHNTNANHFVGASLGSTSYRRILCDSTICFEY
jgi:hypothetical protein